MSLRIGLILFLVSSLFTLDATCQEEASMSEEYDPAIGDLIATGNQLLSRGNFSSAISIWEEVAKSDPDNANAYFKLGLCYRNALDHDEDALVAFKSAVKEMTGTYKFGDPEQTAAPYDAMYFLGEAYLTRDLPDSALESFILYQGYFEDETPINIDRHILYCINAKRMKKSLRDVTFEDAGEQVNSSFSETHPVATLDDNLLFYASRRLRSDNSNSERPDKVFGQYDLDIYVATRQGNAWVDATLFPLSEASNEVPLAISKDGLKIYYRSDKGGDENIFVSEYEGGVWRKPKEAPGKLNSRANESSFSISEDETEIYFVSDREGGEGGSDIYMIRRKNNGKWERAVNLGSNINSAQNEKSVFIHPTGNTLFWSSNGYLGKGMGGYDIYYAEKQPDGSWGNPHNMGYPVNTSGDDLYYYIGGGGRRYYSKQTDESSLDIYAVTGGGFEFENLELGTEVVTLTQEMEVAEILEVEKEVQTEVEVLDLSILDEFDTDDDEDVEEIDLTDMGEEEEEEPEEQEEPEFDELNVSAIDMERLSEEDRDSLITLVQNWIEASSEAEEVSFTSSGSIQFDKSSRKINAASAELLNEVAKQLMASSEKKAVLIGHTDETGDWTVNFRISRERAWEAYRYLRNRGVSRSQLIYYGKGSTEPAASNATEQGREQNRRVEITIID